MKNLEKHTKEFTEDGFTVLENGIPNADLWRKSIINSPNLKEIHVPEEKRLVSAGKGSLKYAVLDRYQTDSVVKELNSFYVNLVTTLKLITQEDVIISPFERSAYYTKVYRNKGDEQGWHYDTNGLTVIAYLTDNVISGRTEIEKIDKSGRVLVLPKAGSLLIMQGKKCWHRAEPILEGIKVICPLNYYVGNAESRDPRLDDIIFGTV
jgi:hypothetical protein